MLSERITRDESCQALETDLKLWLNGNQNKTDVAWWGCFETPTHALRRGLNIVIICLTIIYELVTKAKLQCI